MVEDLNADDATHAPDLGRDLLTGFSAGVMRAADHGSLRLNNLGGVLRFIDQVHVVSQGISSVIDLQRAVDVADDLEQPFPVSRANMSAILDLAGFAARDLKVSAGLLQRSINEQGKMRTASRPPRAAIGRDDGR